MVFSYVVMQALPPILPTFQSLPGTISALANILYGEKRMKCFLVHCVYHIHENIVTISI